MTRLSRQRGLTLLELAVVVAILAVVAALVIGRFEGVRDNAEDTAARATMQTVREAFVGSAAGPGYVSDMKRLPGFSLVNIRMCDLLVQGQGPTRQLDFDPITQRGWRGPYLDNVQPVRNRNAARNGKFPNYNEQRFEGDDDFFERHFYTSESPTGSPYGETGDAVAADPWGNPIVLQIPEADAFSEPDAIKRDAKRWLYARVVSAGSNGKLETPLDRTAGMLPGDTVTARGDDLVLFLNRTDVYEPEDPAP